MAILRHKMKIHYHIEQSRTINVSADQLKNTLTDLNEFLVWSPWNCLDDHASANIANPIHQEGHSLHWSGPVIGEGIQTLTKISDHTIESRLDFLKPFKAVSPTKFELKSKEHTTEVTWSMEGSLPFFLFFLKKMMTVMLTRDLERGLDRLKEYCEEGKVHSLFSKAEKIDVDTFYFQGIEGRCTLAEIPQQMRLAFEKITSDIRNQKIKNHHGLLSVYHNIDPIKALVHYTAGAYFTSEPEAIAGYHQGKIETHKAIKLTLKGPYHHLKTAWGKAFAFQRTQKLKLNKKIPMVEIMLNDPSLVAKEDILTEIRLAIK